MPAAANISHESDLERLIKVAPRKPSILQGGPLALGLRAPSQNSEGPFRGSLFGSECSFGIFSGTNSKNGHLKRAFFHGLGFLFRVENTNGI